METKQGVASEPTPIAPVRTLPRIEPTTELLRELVSHLRQNRRQLREEWVRRITEAQLLTAMRERL